MSGERQKLRFFLDEGVADSVGTFLDGEGHMVIRLRDSITVGSSDPFVCVAAEANDAILIAHDGDMKGLAKRHGVTSGRFKSLSLLTGC